MVTMQEYSDLSHRLEYLKDEFDLSNGRIAEICEVNTETIRLIVIGTTKNPRVSIFNKLTSFLGIPYEWLVEGKGELPKNIADQKKYEYKIDNSINQPSTLNEPFSNYSLPEMVKYLRQELDLIKNQLESCKLDRNKFIDMLMESQRVQGLMWKERNELMEQLRRLKNPDQGSSEGHTSK